METPNDSYIEQQPGLPPRDVLEYLEIPLRRPVLFILPLALFIGLAICAYSLAPRVYKSATLILLEAERVPDHPPDFQGMFEGKEQRDSGDRAEERADQRDPERKGPDRR